MPQYCCAILRDAAGRYLLERRPESSRDAPNQLTCFGGKREPNEHPDRCIRRELFEELNWRTGALRLSRCLRLTDKNDTEIAWFYRAAAPGPGVTIRPLDGVSIEWLDPDHLAHADLSGWHRAALEAERNGEPVARIDHSAPV